MTFFLPQEAPPKIKANNPDIDLEASGLSAAITTAQLENDANFIARRRTLDTQTQRTWEAAKMLGSDAISERAREQGIPDETISLFAQMMERQPNRMPDQMQALVSDMARAAAAADPEAWVNLDLSEEAITKATNEALQAEYEDAQGILDMMPSSFVTNFVGGMVGATLDVKNLPFLLLGGGGGSILRVAGREALINTAAEAAFLPSQFDMAQRLDIPDPDVPTHLAMSALAGGLFGGGMEATVRGLTYWKGRNRVSGSPVMDEMVNEAEDILTSDVPSPFEAVNKSVEEQALLVLENPLPRWQGEAVAGRTENVTFPEIRTRADLDVSSLLESNARYQAARAADPRLFEQWDAIRTRQDTLRRWMDDLRAGKTNTREETLSLIDARIEELEQAHKVTQGKSNKAKIREEIRQAKADREEITSSDANAESRDERMVRDQLIRLDEQARDLAPRIGAAYRASEPEVPAPFQSLRQATPDQSPIFQAAETQRLRAAPQPRTPDGRFSKRPRPKQEAAAPEPRSTAEVADPIFDDPSTPEAGVLHEVQINELRSRIETDGASEMRIELPDGEILNSDADVLRYLEESDTFANDVKVCLIGGPE